MLLTVLTRAMSIWRTYCFAFMSAVDTIIYAFVSCVLVKLTYECYNSFTIWRKSEKGFFCVSNDFHTKIL